MCKHRGKLTSTAINVIVQSNSDLGLHHRQRGLMINTSFIKRTVKRIATIENKT